MTLPNDDIVQFLDGRFVLSHRNIEKDAHVGWSHGYKPTQKAVGTTNGAGPRNVQFLVLSHDETVLHALPGFWHPEDLIRELTLALEVDRLYRDEQLHYDQKHGMLRLLHRSFLRRHGDEMQPRSGWQNFDRTYEQQRAEHEQRDTFTSAGGRSELKSVLSVVHDRMLERPFRSLDEFDLEAFVDYGRPFYDNNHGERGRSFSRAERVNRKRAAALADAREKRAREQAKRERKQRRSRGR